MTNWINGLSDPLTDGLDISLGNFETVRKALGLIGFHDASEWLWSITDITGLRHLRRQDAAKW